MAKRVRTDHVVVHCSATRAIQNVNVDDIRRWHKAKGWKDIGYHYVITRNGTVQTGRPLGDVGSHVQGHNHNSVGICLVGGLNNDTWKPEANYTAAQWKALLALVKQLIVRYPKAKILGHRDFPGVKKACPCFNAKTWAKSNKLPV